MLFGADDITRQDGHGRPEFGFGRRARPIANGSDALDGHRYDAAHLRDTIERKSFAGRVFLLRLLGHHICAVGCHRSCMADSHRSRRGKRAERVRRLQPEETA